LFQDGVTWLNTIVVSAFKDGKWVFTAVHHAGAPEAVAWIAESFQFN
jgi:hypothetical protein